MWLLVACCDDDLSELLKCKVAERERERRGKKEFGETHYACHSLGYTNTYTITTNTNTNPCTNTQRKEGRRTYHQSQIGSDSVGLPGSLYWVPDLTAAGESESGEDGDDGEEAEHRGSAV